MCMCFLDSSKSKWVSRGGINSPATQKTVAPTASKNAVVSVEPTLCLRGVDSTGHPAQLHIVIAFLLTRQLLLTSLHRCIAPTLQPTTISSTHAEDLVSHCLTCSLGNGKIIAPAPSLFVPSVKLVLLDFLHLLSNYTVQFTDALIFHRRFNWDPTLCWTHPIWHFFELFLHFLLC